MILSFMIKDIFHIYVSVFYLTNTWNLTQFTNIWFGRNYFIANEDFSLRSFSDQPYETDVQHPFIIDIIVYKHALLSNGKGNLVPFFNGVSFLFCRSLKSKKVSVICSRQDKTLLLVKR